MTTLTLTLCPLKRAREWYNSGNLRMDFVSSHDVTEMLNAWRKGDNDALEKLIPVVYAELHRLASRYMRKEDRAHTLQTTALVHEAYCRLIDQKEIWQNRAHFFGIAAQLMRRILVDHARTKLRIDRKSVV